MSGIMHNGVLYAGYPSQQIQKVEGMIGDAYDNTATYTVGDFCIYNNTLYKCTTAVSTAEDFDSTKWTATQIDDEISQINSSKVKKTSFTATTNSSGLIQGATSALFGVENAIILSAYLERGSYSTRRTVDIEMYGNGGYGFLCKSNGTAINSQSVTITVTYVVI